MSTAHPAVHFAFWQKAREAAQPVRRAAVSTLVIGLAILVGVAIPDLLADRFGGLGAAGLAIGTTTLLAVTRDLLETLPTAVDYIVSGANASLPKLFAEIAVAALGIGFAWHSVMEGPAAPLVERSLSLNVGGSLPPIVLNESDSVFVTYLTFREDTSELEPGQAQLAQVDALVATLAECIQAPEDRVDLLIRAYASSSGSDASNVALYKGRGAYVEDLLKARIEELASAKRLQFDLAVRDWKSLELMKLRRLFKDTDSGGTYLEHAASLNRRAEILVRSAGSCFPS